MEDLFLRFKEDGGFAGPTHSLSAVAIFLLLAAFVPSLFFGKFLKTTDIVVFIASIIIVAGGSLTPDLDNVQSTAKSALGYSGDLISKAMRQVSIIIFSLTKTRYDETSSNKFAGANNPHRQFWHTLASAFLVGAIVYATTKIQKIITIPLINKKISIGLLFTGMWLAASMKMAIAGLFNKRFNSAKRAKSSKRMITINLLSFLFAVIVILIAPTDIDYYWVAYAYTFGIIIHLLGDLITIQGTPLFWPFKHKGKRWWSYKLIGIRSNGDIEKYVVIPTLVIIILISILTIVLRQFGGVNLGVI